MGPQGQHFAAAAHNRCAQLLVLSGEPDVALESLAVALALAEKSTAHGAQLKAQGGLVRGHALRCKVCQDDDNATSKHFQFLHVCCPHRFINRY